VAESSRELRLSGHSCYAESLSMKELPTRRGALGLAVCALVCAGMAAVSLWPPAGRVRSEDRNGDGRPDVWRQYDRWGTLTEVAIDTNFDGRSDVYEYYDQGVLVRRESDRNFNGQVDLVEEFEATTHENFRSVIDVDYDGTADLLVFFRGGRLVVSQWAHPVAAGLKWPDDAPARRAESMDSSDGGQLAPMTDPFRRDPAVRAIHRALGSDACVGLSTSGGLPGSSIDAVVLMTASARLVAPVDQPRSLTAVLPRSPRGPPLT
jgi:hypothetical protein